MVLNGDVISLFKTWCRKLRMTWFFMRKSAPQLLSALEGFSRALQSSAWRSSRPSEGFHCTYANLVSEHKAGIKQSERIKSSVGFWHSYSEDLIFCKKCYVFCFCRRITFMWQWISGTFKTCSSGIKICTNHFCILWNECWVVLAPKLTAEHSLPQSAFPSQHAGDCWLEMHGVWVPL